MQNYHFFIIIFITFTHLVDVSANLTDDQWVSNDGQYFLTHSQNQLQINTKTYHVIFFRNQNAALLTVYGKEQEYLFTFKKNFLEFDLQQAFLSNNQTRNSILSRKSVTDKPNRDLEFSVKNMCSEVPCSQPNGFTVETCKIKNKIFNQQIFDENCSQGNIDSEIKETIVKQISFSEVSATELGVCLSKNNKNKLLADQINTIQSRIIEFPYKIISCEVAEFDQVRGGQSNLLAQCGQFIPSNKDRGLNKFKIAFNLKNKFCIEYFKGVSENGRDSKNVASTVYHELAHQAIRELGPLSPITHEQLEKIDKDCSSIDVNVPTIEQTEASVSDAAKNASQALASTAKEVGWDKISLGEPVNNKSFAGIKVQPSQPWLPRPEQITALLRPATTVAEIPAQQERRKELDRLVEASVKSFERPVAKFLKIVESPAFAATINAPPIKSNSPPISSTSTTVAKKIEDTHQKPKNTEIASAKTSHQLSSNNTQGPSRSTKAQANSSKRLPAQHTNQSNINISQAHQAALKRKELIRQITQTPPADLLRLLKSDAELVGQIKSNGIKIYFSPHFQINPDVTKIIFEYDKSKNKMIERKKNETQ